MIRHPKPTIIARQLRRLADILDDEGDKATRRAAVLAARGYPTSTAGGGRNGTADCSSTERAAGLAGDDGPLTPPPYTGIDERLAKQLRVVWGSARGAEDTIHLINSKAADDDPIPVGTGMCIRCDRFCRPSKKDPNDRLRLQLCPADYRAFKRWQQGRPIHTPDDRDQWLYERWLDDNPEGDREAWLKIRKAQIEAA